MNDFPYISKQDIEGFQLPLWNETLNLVKQAALCFLPIRTIGWDIAISPRGPVIMEANMWWNPPNLYGNGRLLQNLVETEC